MSRFDYVLNAITFGVNWPLLFYVACATIILIVFVRVLRLSPLHATVELIKEITQTFTGAGPIATRSSIDGILTISAILFTAIMAAPFAMSELYSAVSFLIAGIEQEHQWPYLFMLMFFTTCISALLSLVLTGRKD